jgi:hypothetical protein
MGTKFEVDDNGNLTITGNTTLKSTLTGVLQANAGAVSAATPVTVVNGGTGVTTFPNGVVHANGTNALSASAVDLSAEVSGQLPVANGGTGVATFPNGVVHANGTNALSASAVDLSAEVSGQLPIANGGTGVTTFPNGVVHANGTNALSASAVDLSAEVSGQLPVANGGTGVTTFPNGVVHANGANALSASAVDLSAEVSGQLPVANGGTGVSTLTGYVIGNGSSGMTASPTIPAANVAGLGNMALQDSDTVNITGGTVVGTNGNLFTIGDGTATGNKTIVANDSKSSKPAIQYNETTSKWQYNNQDGNGWSDMGTIGAVAYIPQPVSPSTNLTASGALYTATAGETLAAGDCCYLKIDGKFWKGIATQTTTMPCVAIATMAISANATGTFLLSGLWRDDSHSYTVGALMYLDAQSAGRMTEIAPSVLGQQRQILGYASSASVVNFMPNLTLVALTANDLGKGYCFGGLTSTSSTIGKWIDGLDLNTEAALSYASAMAVARARPGPGSSSVNVYLAGGQGLSDYYLAVYSVDKFSYSTATSILTSSSISRGGECGAATGSVAMYTVGQSNPQGSYQNLIQKIAFATDVITTPSMVQSVARNYETCFSNSGFTKGYVTGGTGSSTGTSIDAITMSTDSCAAISAVLSDVRQQAQPYASSTYGYWAGGQNLSSNIATIDKLAFSNEARTASSASLPAARAWGAGIRSVNAGYSCGGQTTANVSSIVKQLFSTDAVTTLAATLAAGARNGLVGGSK